MALDLAAPALDVSVLEQLDLATPALDVSVPEQLDVATPALDGAALAPDFGSRSTICGCIGTRRGCTKL